MICGIFCITLDRLFSHDLVNLLTIVWYPVVFSEDLRHFFFLGLLRFHNLVLLDHIVIISSCSRASYLLQVYLTDPWVSYSHSLCIIVTVGIQDLQILLLYFRLNCIDLMLLNLLSVLRDGDSSRTCHLNLLMELLWCLLLRSHFNNI